MEDEKVSVSESTVENDTTNNYIETINEMKKNTVSKDLYAQLKEENKQLLNTIVNGNYNIDEDSDGKVEEEPVDLDALRKEMFSGNCSNLKYAEDALKLREEILEKDNVDIFLPHGQHIQPTKEDVESVQNVVNCLQHCIDEADGDSSIFTLELQKYLTDPIIAKASKNRKIF